MKLFVRSLALLALLAAGVLLSFAEPDWKGRRFADCVRRFDLDTCVACLNPGQGGGNAAACLCKFLDDRGLLRRAGYSNLGECIADNN